MEITVNGAKFWYEEVGRVTDPASPSCLLVHGGPGTDHAYFRPWMDELGCDLRLVYYDHRGHGRSERRNPKEGTLEQLVDDMEGLRQALGLGKIVLLGSSFGGFLSLLYAVRYGQHLSRLILVGAASSHHFRERADANAEARATSEIKAALRRMWDGSIKSDEDYRKAFETIMPLYFYRREDASKMNKETIYRIDIRNFIIQTQIPRFDVRGQLKEIQVPTLVTVGRHDWICPVDQAEIIHRGIAGSQLAIFERSGHNPFIEEPESFFATVRRFLG